MPVLNIFFIEIKITTFSRKIQDGTRGFYGPGWYCLCASTALASINWFIDTILLYSHAEIETDGNYDIDGEKYSVLKKSTDRLSTKNSFVDNCQKSLM